MRDARAAGRIVTEQRPTDRVPTEALVSDFPAGVTGAIGHALALNLRHHAVQFGTKNLHYTDLYTDVITALK